MVDSHETHDMCPSLSATRWIFNEINEINKINEIKDYFVTEVKERQLKSIRFSKYIAFFYYFDK